MGCRRSDDSAELRGDMTEEETDRLLHANLGRLEAIAAAGGGRIGAGCWRLLIIGWFDDDR